MAYSHTHTHTHTHVHTPEEVRQEAKPDLHAFTFLACFGTECRAHMAESVETTQDGVVPTPLSVAYIV